MRWFVRTRVPLLTLVLLTGISSVRGVTSTNFVEDAAVVTALPDCGSRLGDPLAWVDACPSAGAAVSSPANVPDNAGASTAVLVSGIVFQRNGNNVLFNPHSGGGCGFINECDCDNSQLLTARIFNSYKRRAIEGLADGACPAGVAAGTGYEVKQRSSGSPGWNNCTTGGLAACPNVDPLTTDTYFLQITQTTGVGPKCGFIVVREPGLVAGKSHIIFEPDTPNCGIATQYNVTNGSNNLGPDLHLVMLLQIKRNGVDGNVKIAVERAEGVAPVSFTVNTTGKTNATVANDIKTGLEGLGLNLRVTIATDAAAAGSIINTFPGSPYEAGQPVVVIGNAGFMVSAIHTDGVTGQDVISEDIDPTPSVPTLNEWAMIIVTLLLLGSGYWLFRRQRNPMAA